MGGELKKGLLGGVGIGVGLGAAEMLSRGLSSLIDIAFDSVKAASDLNEAVSKSEAVFKDSAAEVEAWAETASDAFGQSKRQALEAAGTFGNLIQAFGIGGDKATEMSKTLVELASDLASFNNTSVDDALVALRSGLSGETEPLKRFGVALSDARLQEEALRLGLIKTAKGTLPIAIKTQAAYALILKDTALAQGDFERTSDGLANTQKTLTAALEDASAELGEALLPVMLEIATFARDEAVPALRELVEALKDAGPVLDVLGKAWDALLRSQNPLGAAIADETERIEEMAAALAEANLAETLRETSRGLAVMAASAKEDLGDTSVAFGGLAAAATDTAKDVERAQTRMADSVEELRDITINAARDIVDKAYQIISDKAELTAVNVEKAELAKVIATGNATREQKARYRELTEAQAGLILDLAENGQENTKVVKTAVAQLRDQLKTATGQERKAILATIGALEDLEAQYKNTARASNKVNWPSGTGGNVGGTVKGDPRRHSGGPVTAGRPYVVGRTGAEELFIPSVSGRIAAIPEIRAAIDGGSRAGDMSITINNPEPRAADDDIGRMLRRVGALGMTGR